MFDHSGLEAGATLITQVCCSRELSSQHDDFHVLRLEIESPKGGEGPGRLAKKSWKAVKNIIAGNLSCHKTYKYKLECFSTLFRSRK